MLNEKDGLFKRPGDWTKFCDRHVYDSVSEVKPAASKILCDSFNKNEEVAGLLKRVGGDTTAYNPDYSTPSIFGVLSFAKLLLINLRKCVDLKIKKEGVIRRTILSNIPFSDQIKKRIEKLPLDTTAEDIFNCFKARNNSVRGLRFYSYSKSKYDPYSGIYINARKIYKILCAMEKVGSDDCSLKIIGNAIKEIDEVLNTMLSNQWVGIIYCQGDLAACFAEHNAKVREEVIKELKEAEAMADNTQTLTLNRPKQQENKIITVGNKKAYQVGKGDYKHRNGIIKDGCVIKEGKKEMGNTHTNPFYIDDKDILADLEDLLNSVIDNPDTVDSIVNCLAKNAPAAHFVSEMIGCGEIYNEESLLKFLDNAYMLSRAMNNAVGGLVEDVTIPPYYEARIGKYLNVAYPKPAFGKEFSLMQFVCCFDDARHDIANIIAEAKAEEEAEEAFEEIIADAAQAQAKEIEDILDGVEAEEQEEEKEEVIANDTVQEHAEEDCEPHAQDHRDYDELDFEELTKLMEERDKEEAEIDAEIKQAEEEARRKELVEQLLAKDKRIAEKKERLAQLRGK